MGISFTLDLEGSRTFLLGRHDISLILMIDADADAAEAAPAEPTSAQAHEDNSSLNTALSRDNLGPEAIASIDYTKTVILQLRVMNDKYALAMLEFLVPHEEAVVVFVETFRLYDEFAAGNGATGTNYSRPLKLTDYSLRLWKKAMCGDGHCLWRTISFILFGTEEYWTHIRLAVLSFCYYEDPALVCFGEASTYLHERQNDVPEGAKAYADWSFITSMIGGQDLENQAGIWEAAAASVLLKTPVILMKLVGVNDDSSLQANVIAVSNNGIMQVEYDEEKKIVFPEFAEAIWIINSPTAKPGEYHWDAVVDVGPSTSDKDVRSPNKFSKLKDMLMAGPSPPSEYKDAAERSEKPAEDADEPAVVTTWKRHGAEAGFPAAQKRMAAAAGKPPTFALPQFGLAPQRSPLANRLPVSPATPIAKTPMPSQQSKQAQAATFPSPKTPPSSATINKDGMIMVNGRAVCQSWAVPAQKIPPDGGIRQLPPDPARAPKGRAWDTSYQLLAGTKDKAREDFDMGTSSDSEGPDWHMDPTPGANNAHVERQIKEYYAQKMKRRMKSVSKKMKIGQIAYQQLSAKPCEAPAVEEPEWPGREDDNPFAGHADIHDENNVNAWFGEEEQEGYYDDEYGDLFGDDEDDERVEADDGAQAAERPAASLLETAGRGGENLFPSQIRTAQGLRISQDRVSMEPGGAPKKMTPLAAMTFGRPSREHFPSKSQVERMKKDFIGPVEARKILGPPDPPDNDPSDHSDSSSFTSDDGRGKKRRRFRDEKIGQGFAFQTKLENFGKKFATGKMSKLDTFKEVHKLEAIELAPTRLAEIDRMWHYAENEHERTVHLENVQEAALYFSAPKSKKREKVFRIRYLGAVLKILPKWVSDELMELCRNGGKWKNDPNIAEDDGGSVAGARPPSTAGSDGSNMFAPGNKQHREFQDSEFFCPEAAFWLLYASSYSGVGKERTAIFNTILPVDPKSLNVVASGVSAAKYETSIDSWKKVVKMSQQFSLPLPDPGSLWTLYRNHYLGGDNPAGVLMQYPDIKIDLDAFQRSENTFNYKANDGEKVLTDITTFHRKVKGWMKLLVPKDGDTDRMRRTDPDDKKKKKKGKGDEEPAPKKGPPKGGEHEEKRKPRKSVEQLLSEKPPSWFTDIQHDGQPRALCSGWVLHGKCEREKGKCIFAQHGGHPQRDKITDEMKRVVQKRLDDAKKKREEKKGKKGKGKGNYNGAPVQPGKGPKFNAAQQAEIDARVKAELDKLKDG